MVPRDIVFLVDMSGSITLKDFAKAMDALADLIGEICGGVNGEMNSNRSHGRSMSDDDISVA